MVEELLRPGEDAWVIRRGRRVRGYFAFSLQPDHPYRGRVAHMDLVLAPSLHGKGIAPFAYRRLLAAMLRRRVRCLHGGTSQGAVLHLARSMGRPLYAWCLRHGPATLSRRHFDYPLPR